MPNTTQKSLKINYGKTGFNFIAAYAKGSAAAMEKFGLEPYSLVRNTHRFEAPICLHSHYGYTHYDIGTERVIWPAQNAPKYTYFYV